MEKNGCGCSVFLCLPILLIGLVIGYEIVGMAVNHIATGRQTKKMEHVIQDEISDAEIIDTYSETGNTSGTGNHVDMLSVVLLRKTGSDTDTIKSGLSQLDDDSEDDWDFGVDTLENTYKQYQETGGWHANYLAEMKVPEDMGDCYIVFILRSAPFSDNIEGH